MTKNEPIDARIRELVNQLEPITLEEMSGIKLMNRTDTKFVTNKHQLARLLQMAHGEYSILYGDDDYLIDGGLDIIFSLISQYPQIPIILTNRISISHEGSILSYDTFLRDDIESRVFNFNNEDEVRAYFSLCNNNTLGGCLSFISSIIYKTSILEEIGEYDERFTGTNYAFMYYWWNYLIKGNELFYYRDSYLKSTTSGATNNNYGFGLKRILVDINGISKVAEYVFTGPYSKYKTDFLSAANKCNSYASIINGFFRHRAMGYNILLPSLSQFGWDQSSINELKQVVSFKNIVIGLIGIILRRR